MKSQRKGSNVPSISSSVVDEETMRSGHNYGQYFVFPFSGLTLMIWWQEEHLALKNSVSLTPKGYLPKQVAEKT